MSVEKSQKRWIVNWQFNSTTMQPLNCQLTIQRFLRFLTWIEYIMYYWPVWLHIWYVSFQFQSNSVGWAPPHPPMGRCDTDRVHCIMLSVACLFCFLVLGLLCLAIVVVAHTRAPPVVRCRIPPCPPPLASMLLSGSSTKSFKTCPCSRWSIWAWSLLVMLNHWACMCRRQHITTLS